MDRLPWHTHGTEEAGPKLGDLKNLNIHGAADL